jgi:capsular polysaccharide transport system ATP-binding protein
MIELRNVTKYYNLSTGRKYVFRDLSVTLPEGANLGLLGRNGAGKSTLLRLIGGIDIPNRGSIVSDKSISWPVGMGSGFQGSLTARENIKFICRVYGADGDEMAAKVRFVEEFAEIGHYFDQPVKTYSSGMRSRVAFGTSMAFDFDYYLIDETMAAGDPQFKKKSIEVFDQKIGRSNMILVSHNLADIRKFCQTIVFLRDGQVTIFDDVEEGILQYTSETGLPPPKERKHKPRRTLEPITPMHARGSLEGDEEAGQSAVAKPVSADSPLGPVAAVLDDTWTETPESDDKQSTRRRGRVEPDRPKPREQ